MHRGHLTVPERPLYQFRHMPFRLCNAAQQLCRLMDKVIPTSLRSNVFVYLDDLIIISADFQTHLKYLELVAECLKNANLIIDMAKSKFCFRNINYLGFIIGGRTLRMDPERVEAIRNIPNPKSVKELRSFLGAVLLQLDDEQHKRPIAFFSAKLNKHQINYSVTEKECLAEKLAIHRFRPYVEMMPFRSVKEVELAPADLLRFQTVEFESTEYQGLVKEVMSQQQKLSDLKVQGRLLFKRTVHDSFEDEVEGTSWNLWVPESPTAGLILRAQASRSQLMEA
ncbi:uncharacterized protein LOC135441018 [Drosophila montana]|uniref:uncharacterized protein LOC135441018 n=1 Tax=Drosophila montana TaxID=40370 RepID=UPI00313B88A5